MEERTLVSFDYAVKYMLRDKSDFVILSGFLTELMGRKVEVTGILESESNKDDPGGKTNRVDLKAQLDNGELAVFEFQFHREVDFFGRVLYGVSRAIIEQVKSGSVYGIDKVYSINIAYYEHGVKQEYLFFGKFGGFKGVHFDEAVQFGVSEKTGDDIHPDYYLILPNKFDERLRGRFDEWVHVLKHSTVPENYTAEGIAEAAVKLDLLRMPPEERKAYENYLNNRHSADSAVLTAKMDGLAEGEKKGLKKGKAEGLKKGRVEGLKKGEAKGLKKGRVEGLKKGEVKGLKKGRAEGRAEGVLQTAKAMKADGMDAKTISRITKLTAAEIRKM